MRHRLLIPLFAAPLMALMACGVPAAELSLSTVEPEYGGLIYIGGAVNNPGL